MKRLSTIITAALAALLCSSCGEFIEEDNALCKYPWQLDSVGTYIFNFEKTDFRAYEPECEMIDFSHIGFWTFSSESRGDFENGTWESEVIPSAGRSFKMTLTSANPGIFIEEGHSGEQYDTRISEDGRQMEISHRHIDSTTFSIYYFSQVVKDSE